MALRPTSLQQPVIPEIAQAYQNDPRTQLARQAIGVGSSTAPVAQGKYAMMDAIARTLSGALGGYQDRKQRDQYGKDEQALLQALQQRGQQGLEGMAAPMPATPPAAPPVPTPPQPAPVAPQTSPVAPQTAMQPGSSMAPPPNSIQPGEATGYTDPLAGRGRLTSPYGRARPGGRKHNGLDYAAPEGSPVGAAAPGTVIRAWNDTANGGGNSVLIRHDDGSITGYAHLGNYTVGKGDRVDAGQPIGAVGNTGRSTGAHLHFTVRDPSGKRVDPATVKFGQPQLAGGSEVSPVTVEAPYDMTQGIPPEQMPTAPEAQPATKSELLRTAYQMMAGGNRYEQAQAREMLTRGLSQQTELNENATARRQNISDTVFQSALQRYGQDRSQLRDQQFNRSERLAGQRYQSGENVLNRDFQAQQAREAQAARVREAELARRADRENLELQVGSRAEREEAKAAAKRSSWYSSPTGMKMLEAAGNTVQQNEGAINNVREFMMLNERSTTGGARDQLPGALATFGSADKQRMAAIANQMSIDLSQKLKGALSNQDMDRVTRATLSIGNNKTANDAIGNLLIGAYERANEFEISRLEARSAGQEVEFMREWRAYTNSVPIGDLKGFSEWKSSLPRYDTKGNRL